ncbi:hypothetical protein G4G28_06790 [Massilia sp. Dwa41.01b]|uniref:hypothetical protein n=1 Tax=Massilia sp. Dwa41.01b TaxID=2709302 RepID=UPI0015FEBB27|nr:hypothetical protein [Massilia sp. Dwa41.01b]QNA88284.1 hypothetical protein G4G28_06790 [Massilia sp. Dwa41.01b]
MSSLVTSTEAAGVKTIRIGVLAYPGCLRSGVVVPLDVLRIANTLSGYRPAGARVRFEASWLGARGEPAISVDGLGFALAPLLDARLDALILPGIAHDSARDVARVLETLAPEMAALRSWLGGGGLLASSCSSTCLVAGAGLLDGRKATTSWWLSAWFRQQFPQVALDADALVVHDGPFVSSGGFGSTMDLTLWLIGHFGGEELRQITAKVLVMDAHRASQAPYIADAMVARARLADDRARAPLAQCAPGPALVDGAAGRALPHQRTDAAAALPGGARA